MNDLLNTARGLIKEKRYDDARAILERMNHPTATAWLDTLNVISPSQAYEKLHITMPVIRQNAGATPSIDTIASMASRELISPVDASNLIPFLFALIGGLIGAVISGGIWAVIAFETSFEVGYVALGVGLITTYFVVLFARKRGLSIAIVAAVCSLLGIFIGKYMTFYFLLREEIATLEPFTGKTWQYFTDIAGDPEFGLFSPFDILWIFLAVSIAWRMAIGRGEYT